MTSFDEKLKTLLKTESSFLDKDWELLEWKLQDSARNADEKLIKLLISDEEIREKFFSEIAWYQVFNGNLFIEYISNKNFLDNSYTKYKNKIWLQINWKFLKESGEVSLVRPFKDCVLEWWQTKEDEKKKEIFFNEVLAQDEIDKLFAPKVLTNFKKYDKDWEHKVEWFNRNENWIIKDNLIIKWNNLLALHTLKKEFEWKIKLIYIDPPYNTWSDSFWYNDNFNHSTWLTFMKNRLEIAKKLLTNDWLIFVHCDANECAYLKILMDEIFLRDNFVTDIAVLSSTPSWVKTAHKEKTIIKTRDSILVYKMWECVLNPQYSISEKWDSHYNYFLEREKLKLVSLKEKLVTEWLLEGDKKLDDLDTQNPKFKEFYLKNKDNIFQTGKSMPEDIREISLKKVDEVVPYWDWQFAYNGRRLSPLSSSINRILTNKWYKEEISKLVCDFWYDIDFNNTQNQWWISFPAWKKPEALLYRIIDMTTKSWDVILDFFLWSWTTAAVSHKMWRQYIWIEQMKYWENDSIVRLKNVIDWEQSGISEALNRQWWWEFIYCELKKYNQEFIEQIETAKNTDELLKIRESMKEKAYFKYNFDMQKFEENMDYFKNWTNSLKEQKELLIEILNKNQLYVNLSDIDDENFEVSDDDKNLNNLFYRV